MIGEGFYIKKQINPRRPELIINPNIVYDRTGKGLKNIQNNIIYTPVNNINKFTVSPINNEFINNQNSQIQNGQIAVNANNMKNPDQNGQNNNTLNSKKNEETKTCNDSRIYIGKGLVKNFVFTNYINYLINNNQQQNKIVPNQNNNSFIYINPTPQNYANRLPINNNAAISQNLSQNIILRENISPIMQRPIIQRPIIPIKKNEINNGFNTPNRNIVKRFIYNKQQYATIQTDNNCELENIDYNPELTGRNDRADYTDSENEENGGYCSKDNRNNNLNNGISTPVKPRNNLNDSYIQYQSPLNNYLQNTYQQYLNNPINTPTNDLFINRQQLYSESKQIHNNNILTNTEFCLSPNRSPTKSNQNICYNKPIDKIYSTSSLPLENNINNIPQISKNLFCKPISIKMVNYLSRAGSEENGHKKINQDSLIALKSVNNIPNFNIFSVLDGHGSHGHLASKFMAQNLIKCLMSNQQIKSLKDPENIYLLLKKNNFQIIKQIFIYIDSLIRNCDFDVNESGTTCLLVIILNNHLISANVGDSRGILVYDENNNPELTNIKVVPLSIDYKLEIEEERNRIIMAGGKVEQIKDSMGVGQGPFRIFKPGENYPGLAMSRSIGDTIAKSLGVIAEPGIKEYNLNEKTKFIVLGSDGIWEFLSNEDVMNVGKQYYLNCDPNVLCEELYSRALIQWKCNDEIVDDITVIVIYF